MSIDDAVTKWIEELKAGDAEAAERIWERYFREVVRLARRRLEHLGLGIADEEDVALSAFKSFCLGAQDGRFPKLRDRDSLWSLLVAITAHKSIDLIRQENRQKRGGTGGASRGDVSELEREAIPLSHLVLEQPSPEFAAQIAEQFQLLLKKLERADDPQLMQIATAKMMGESTDSIANRLGCVRRTVERKIKVIRRIWAQECD